MAISLLISYTTATAPGLCQATDLGSGFEDKFGALVDSQVPESKFMQCMAKCANINIQEIVRWVAECTLSPSCYLKEFGYKAFTCAIQCIPAYEADKSKVTGTQVKAELGDCEGKNNCDCFFLSECCPKTCKCRCPVGWPSCAC